MDLAFTLNLHRAVDPDPGNDLCWSPYSAISALGLLAAAAEGAARTELVAALFGGAGSGHGCDDDLTRAAALLTAAAELTESPLGEQLVLAMSNTLWAAEDLPIRHEFAKELSRWPAGAIRGAPFGNTPDDTRKLINADVAETTRGLIPELIPPQAIRPDTIATLVSALYLRTPWRHPFSPENTAPRPFHAPTGTYHPPTMRQTERLGYAHRDGWQVLMLPAAGGIDTVILLPDKDLTVAEPEIDARGLAALLAAPVPTRAQLSMPKVTVTTRVSLKHPLVEMGVRTPFARSAAGLTRLCPDPRMRVDDVLHESVLMMDEQGVEGAAATAVTMRKMAMVLPSDPVVVDVDRPFLIMVVHHDTRVPYFMARVVHP